MLDDQDETEIPQNEAEMAVLPVAEGETPPTEEGEGLVVTIGEEPEAEAETEAQKAPEWVKDLRRQNREYQKRIRQLERNTQVQVPAQGETVTAPPKKPTLADADYDTGAYEAQLDSWYAAKAEYERQAGERQRAEQSVKGAWEAKVNGYNAAKAELKARDFDDAEAVIADTLSVTQQGIILDGAEKPALLIYALGKNPKKAAELAAITNPVAFAAAIGRLEANLKVTKRSPSAAPEQIMSGNAPKSSAIDNQLEKLRAEAERTGNYSKVMAYKRTAKRG